MKGRLIFVTDRDEIITADINMTMENAEGIYSDESLMEFQLKCIGFQWLPDEELGHAINASVDIGAVGANKMREEAKNRLKIAED